MIKDGWHKWRSYDILVLDGKVVQGIKTEFKGSQTAVWPYKNDKKLGCWVGAQGVKYETFRKGDFRLF